MKQYLYIAALSLAAMTSYAQQDANTPSDAVRLAQDNLTGTARFRAMSGAFGAVGGDLSALNVNPAGSAIFNFNSGTGSLTSYNVNNSSNYFGTKTRENESSFDLNQLGFVFVFNNTKEDATWKKFSLAFNYENTNNFDNNLFSAGINPSGSIDQYFLRYANGIGSEGGIELNTLNNAYFEDLSYIDQQAYLGYNAFVFNPVTQDATNTAYTTNVPAGGNNYQENATVTTGYNGKVTVNLAGQLMDRFYLGANINVHFTDYLKNSSYYEEFNNAGVNDLQWVQFDNQRYTYGGGFSFNLGAIAKVTDALRVGIAYESPTWYTLQDEVTQSISANVGGDFINTNPGVTIIMDDYSIKTPAKITGSLAYVFGRNGLISIDYARKDYSTTEFSGNNYNTLNEQLEGTLTTADEIRVGLEYRIKNVSLRGGYRYEGSPYKNELTIGELTGFSGGIGFSFNSSRLDLAYSYYNREMNVPVLTEGLSTPARINSDNNNVTLSYTIDL